MKTIWADPKRIIKIGRLGENERLRVGFNVSDLQEELPGATFIVVNKGPADENSYPCPGVTVEDNAVFWPITSADLKAVGEGKCELIATVDNVIAKTIIYNTMILEALDGSGEVPTPWEDWGAEFAGMVADAQEAATSAATASEAAVTSAETAEAASQAIQDMSVVAVKRDPGTGVTVGKFVNPETGAVQLRFGIEQGDPGFSPEITVINIQGGHRVIITREDGTSQTFDVMDGANGADGATGPQGEPGFSPTVQVTDITGGHQVAITDLEGTHTFDVVDGEVSQEEFDELKSAVADIQNDITNSATGGVDFNTYITSGKTYINSHEIGIASNRPPLTGSICLLVVNVSDTGVVMQTAVYPQLGAIYTRRRKADGTEWSEWLTASEMAIAVAQGPIDFNNYMTQGSIYIGSTEMGTASNAPTNDRASYCIVHVEVATNNVITQTAVFPLTGVQYIRRRNAAGTSWSEWLTPKIPDLETELSEISDDVASLKSDITDSVTGIVDFNTYITSGKTYIGSTEVGTALNRPPLTGSFCMLVVNVSDTGVVMQTAMYSQLGSIYTRRRNAAGTSWSEWLPTSEGAIYLDVLFTNPVVTKLCFTTKQARKGLQDIAVYNGNIFDMESGYVYVNGGTKFAIDNGHGNNAMFGETLHGDYPYLYCGSWTHDECEIYVNQVTNTSSTLVRTISFSGLSGYLNMCVDEADGKIYILLCTSAQTSTGDIDFIVADLSTGEIISRKTLDFKIPILQGMQFSNDRIYVAYGNVASGIPNRIIALTPNGDISCKSNPISVSEIEGIAFDGNKMYIADTSNIYSM